jgi:hypothetical protein
MLESKKKMGQSFGELKVALEKGKGDPLQIFRTFEEGCRAFLKETAKVPPEAAERFLKKVGELGEKIAQGDQGAAIGKMDEIRALKQACHEAYK